MKKILLLLLLITGLSNAQIVNIPDANFKTKLLQANTNNTIAYSMSNAYFKIDANNNGEIEVSEALQVKRLYVGSSNIVSMIGISSFTNLQLLSCSYNSIQTIDLSNMTNLLSLSIDYNQLASINLSGVNNLTYLGVSNNQLQNLDVTNSIHLEVLYCSNNTIQTLDLTNQTSLVRLNFSNNQIQTIDVSNNATNMIEFMGSGNSQLTTILAKNGYNEFDGVYFGNCPNLIYFCADEFQLSYLQSLISNVWLLPNCQLNTYCTFQPGGDYNTITGSVLFDVNNNGCDSNDIKVPNSKINSTDGSNISLFFANNSGDYTFYAQVGNYTLTPLIENPTWFTLSPSSASQSFSTLNNTVTQNFCLSPVGIHNDLEVVIVPSAARPGFDTTYQIIYRNKGNQTLSGTVQFTYEDDVLDYVSAFQSPDVQNTGSLTWNYTNLVPFEVRTVTVTLNVNSPMETPAVNIGDQLDFTATINPISGDETPLDNVFGLKQIVVGSFDPNDKTCLEGTVVSTSKIGDFLHYNINFENTGTFPATFVVVKDMIDAAKFDVSTLQVLNASHPMETRVAGNKVEFIFDDINLGPNQHGNVVFKIKTKSTLVEGNTVTNNANIYFDYNFPIETNTTSTTFQTLSNGEFPTDYSVVIAPNPTKNNVNINCNSNIQSIQLFDVQGRVLMTQLENDSQSTVDVSNYTNGIYFVKVTTENGTTIEKIIKE